MFKDRNLSSHTYDQVLADSIFARIKIYTPIIRRSYLELEQQIKLGA